MPEEHKTVFISYRRSVASFIARATFLDLRAHDYDVFMDVESIDSGTFDTIILNQIEARAHFILILTPGTVERFVEDGDWLRREVEHAMANGRNIVPLFVNEFKFNDDVKKYLTGELAELPRFNGLNVPHDYFDAAMEKLRKRFLKQPVTGAIKPTPAAEQAIVEQKIEEAAAQPAPTEAELSAEEYFSRALVKQEVGDNHGAIADYDEAIRLNPQYARAYNNRGVAHYSNGDLSGAIADYDEAIHLDPQFTEAFNNRGNARQGMSDLSGAIADYNEAIHLDPQYVRAYNNRGAARSADNDLSGAIADFDEAIHFDAQYAEAYNNRGEVHFEMGEFEQARSDFQQVNMLRPAYTFAVAGLAITQHTLGQKAEAKRLWKALLAQDERYQDVDWVGKELNWRPELVDAARTLISEL